MNETKLETKADESSATPTLAETSQVKKNIILQEQFRSTKRWNDLIETFCINMPLKRHWRNFRTYSDCFTASEAIEWLYRHLKSNQNFSHLPLSRQNAIKVLQIFLKDKIIEDVRLSSNAGSNNSNGNLTSGGSDSIKEFKEFQDDDRVYKFNSTNKHYMNRMASTSSSSALSSTTVAATSTLLSSSSVSNTNSAKTIGTTSQISMEMNSLVENSTLTNNNISENKENVSSLGNGKKQNVGMSINSIIKSSLNQINEKKSSKKASEQVRESEKLNKVDMTTSTNISTISETPLFQSTKNASTINKETSSNKDAHHKQLTRAHSSTSSTNQKVIEIWSKTTRKMLESVLKKAVLNNNIYRLNSSISSRIAQQNQLVKGDVHSHGKSSTLKRSSDIKLNLGTLLDKKAYDTLMSIYGTNIKHNCTHINKHGVVINTNDDLPSWLVKAMTTLLLWDNESNSEDQFPKFKDVFDEVNNYFNDLKEPLLTKDLSHLFIQILNLLIIPTLTSKSNNSSKSSRGKSNHIKENLYEKIYEEFEELVPAFVTSVVSSICEVNSEEDEINMQYNINKLIELVKDQLICNQLELEEQKLHDYEDPENKCITYRLLDAILCLSSSLEEFKTDNRKHMENSSRSSKFAFIDSTSSYNNVRDDEYDDEMMNQENELLLQNLLLASVSRLENCCDDCSNTFNEINNLFFNLNEDEDNEDCENDQNIEFLRKQFETTQMLDNNETKLTDLSVEKLKQAYLSEILARQVNGVSDHELIDENLLNNLCMTSYNNFFNAFMDDNNETIDKTQVSFQQQQEIRNEPQKSKKLNRNHSFRAAIGEMQTKSFHIVNQSEIIHESVVNNENQSYENDDLFKMPTPKRLIRSVTNNSSTNSNQQYQQQTTLSCNDLLNSSISSSLISTASHHQNKQFDFSSNSSSSSSNDTFKFKLPFQPPLMANQQRKPNMSHNQSINMTKSFSMNLTSLSSSSLLNRTFDNENITNQNFGLGRRPSINLKRKVATINTKLNINNTTTCHGINHSSSFSLTNQTAKTLKSTHGSMTTSSTNVNYGVLPSYSLTSLNTLHEAKKFKYDNFSSLRNLTNVGLSSHRTMQKSQQNSISQHFSSQPKLSKLSLTELSSFIRTNIRSANNNRNENEMQEDVELQEINEQKDKKGYCKITLATEIDSEIFYFVINALRLCALMLPPTCKRKLHLLLRFLNKLKHNKHTAKYLIDNETRTSPSSFFFGCDGDDFNYIDSSLNNQSSNQSCLSIANQNHNGGCNKIKLRLNNDLENKSNAIESVIIKSFLNSIVYFDKNDTKTPETEQNEDLAIKLVQILINNYTEIMRIPEDLIATIKQKLTILKSNANHEPVACSTSIEQETSKLSSANNRYCSKISLQQYDRQKAESSKKHLTNLLNNILTDVNMKEHEKLMRLRKFKESHPQVYEEKYPTIKKALTILGISETILNDETISKSHITTNKDEFDFLKKKVFIATSENKIPSHKSQRHGTHNLNTTTMRISNQLNQTTANIFSNSKGLNKLFNKMKRDN